MKTFFLSLLAVFTFVFAKAQKFKNVEHNQFKINFLSPGLEYEKGIGENTSLLVGANLQFYTRPVPFEEVWGFMPAAFGEFRYYTNFNRRIVKNKEIAGNSGNYIGFRNNTYFVKSSLYDSVDIEGGVFGHLGPLYGLQRTYLRGFNFNVQLGFGYYYDAKYDGMFAPIGGLSIGWVF